MKPVLVVCKALLWRLILVDTNSFEGERRRPQTRLGGGLLRLLPTSKLRRADIQLQVLRLRRLPRSQHLVILVVHVPVVVAHALLDVWRVEEVVYEVLDWVGDGFRLEECERRGRRVRAVFGRIGRFGTGILKRAVRAVLVAVAAVRAEQKVSGSPRELERGRHLVRVRLFQLGEDVGLVVRAEQR